MRPTTPGTSWLRMATSVPFKRGFDVDAVVGEQARRVAVEHGRGGAGVASLLFSRTGRVQGELEHRAGAAGDEFFLVFLDANAALLRYSCRVNPVDAVFTFGVSEDAGDGGVADEVGLALRDAARVGDVDVFQMAGCGVGEENGRDARPSRCKARLRGTPRG